MAVSFEQAYPVIYKGWGEPEARADFALYGQKKWDENTAQGGGSVGSSGQSAIDIAKQMLEFQKASNQPAISSLEASLPEISQKFETERGRLGAEITPLQERYKNLLDQATKQTQLATSREFGRRGVSTESGLYDTTLAERIDPIAKEFGLAQESDIRNIQNQIAALTGQETEQQRAVKMAIAQLQAGDSGGALQQALSILELGEGQRQFDVKTELKKKELELAEREGQTQLQAIDLGGTGYIWNPITGEIVRQISGSMGSGSSWGNLSDWY